MSAHVYKDIKEYPLIEENMLVRLDEPVKSKEETEALGIEVGNVIGFAPRFEKTAKGYVKSRHLDDKATAAVLLPHCFPTASQLLTYCYPTASLLLPNCFPTASPLLPYCFPTASQLLPNCSPYERTKKDWHRQSLLTLHSSPTREIARW